MKQIDWEIRVLECPIQGGEVSMDFCETCECHKGADYREGNVAYTSGKVKCTADEEEDPPEEE